MAGKRIVMAMWMASGLLLATVSGCTASREARPQPTVVAVIDSQKAFNDLDEKAELESWRQKMLRDIKAEYDRKNEKIEELINGPHSDTFDEHYSKSAVLDAWLQIEERRMTKEVAARLDQVRIRMLRAINIIAEREGIDIVLNRETVLNLPRATSDETVPVTVRGALWHRDAVDITDEVSGMLNNEFRSRPPDRD